MRIVGQVTSSTSVFRVRKKGNAAYDGGTLVSNAKKTVATTLRAALATLVSRLLGFVRDALIAFYLGAGADAFLAAFRIPNIMRRLVAEGALGMAHTADVSAHPMPCTAEKTPAALYNRDGLFSLHIAHCFMLAATGIFIILYLFAPLALKIVAPGLPPELLSPAASYLRMCALYLPPAAASAVLAALLIARGEAGRAALSPVFLNCAVIGAVALASLATGQEQSLSLALAIGVAVGGFAQLFWLVWHVKTLMPDTAWQEFCLRLMLGKNTFSKGPQCLPPAQAEIATGSEGQPPVRGLGRLFCTVIGASGIQLHLLAGMAAASLLPQGAITALYFAERLVEFPLALAGGAVLAAVLPDLARSVKEHSQTALHEQLIGGLRLVLFLALPATAGLLALAQSIVQALFTYGAFGAEESRLAALALQCLVTGLPAMCLVKPLTGALAALGSDGQGTAHRDMACAALLGTLAVLVGSGLLFPVLTLFNPAPLFPGVCAVALAISLGAWVQTFLLYRSLKARGVFQTPWPHGCQPIAVWTVAATALGAVIGLLPMPDGRMGLFFALLGVMALSMVIWFGGFFLAGNREARLMCQSLRPRAVSK